MYKRQVLEYAATELGVYRTKHILLKTVDTDKPLTDDSDRNTGLYEPLDDATVAEKKKLAEDCLLYTSPTAKIWPSWPTPPSLTATP